MSRPFKDLPISASASPSPYLLGMSTSNQRPVQPKSASQNEATNKSYNDDKQLYMNFDLPTYCRKHGLSDEAAAYLREASLAPSRRPNGFRSNTIKLPCPKFGEVVTAESINLENAYLLIAGARPDVVRIYDQGPRVKVQGTRPDGGAFCLGYTPDFVVLTEKGVEIVELENAQESAAYFLKANSRYKVIDGRYTSPPVEEFFAKLNFKFRILSEADLDARFAQNARFIHPYQVGHPGVPITETERVSIFDAAKERPGIMLSDIEFSSPARRAEVAYHLIAAGVIFTHLSECQLEHPEQVRLFVSRQKEHAFQLLRGSTRKRPTDLKSLGFLLKPGSLLEIDGKDYRVRVVDQRIVTFLDVSGKPHKLPHQALLDLKPRIGGLENAEKTFEAVLADASREDLLEFQERRNAISPYLPGGSKASETPTDRSTRRWRDRFREEHLKTGVGLAAIFPGYSNRGNREPRFNERVETLIKHGIDKYYLAPSAGSAMDAHLRILALGRRLKIAGSQLPTYCTIARRCAALDPFKKAYRRFGKKFANKYRPIHRRCSLVGSPHGQKSFMVAHCDSTQLDLAYTHEDQSTRIEHLWLTKMVDAFDGRVLAKFTCKRRPCADSLEALMLDCVEKHGALPASIVVDWGSEHRNTWMETTMARIGVVIVYRPKSTPVNGAPVESYFSKITKELIHNISGNTKLLQHARQLTKAVDPRNHTVWSESMIIELLEIYYNTANETPRRTKPSPNQIAAECEARFGPPPVQLVDRDMLRRILLPFVSGIKRKISPRGSIRCGDATYAADELRHLAGRFVNIRHDRKDPRIVFADHPTQRRVIDCDVVSTNLKYADDAEEAIQITERSAQHRTTSSDTIEESRVCFTEKLIHLEEKIEEAEKAAKRAKKRTIAKKNAAESNADTLAAVVPIELERIIQP